MGIIIPNWHPVFVHFTVALIMVSAAVHVLHLFIDGDKESLKIKTATVANWNLWIGAGLTLITITAGWLAYNSVEHDAPSHAAMTLHKNWAFGTAGFIIAVAIWSYRHAAWAIRLSKPIIFATVVAAGLVGVTAWLGGEVVYRYGLGVMSLPKTDSHSHAAGSGDHSHDDANSSQEHGDAASHEHDESSDHGHDSLDEHSGADTQKHDSTDAVMLKSKPVEDDGHAHSHDDASESKTLGKSPAMTDKKPPHLDDGHSH